MKLKLIIAIVTQLSFNTINAQTNFWGISSHGSEGFLYRTDGDVVKKLDFYGNYYSYGLSQPSSTEFCLADNGMLYFTVNSGGAHDNGGIVEFDPNTNRCIPVYYFDTTVGYEGRATKYSLIKASNGKLYGTIEGLNLSAGDTKSIIYEFDTNTYAFTEKYIFHKDFKPNGKLTQLANGFLYGTARGLSDISDIIYQFDIDASTMSIKYEYIWGDDIEDGTAPGPFLVDGGNNVLYGMTFHGGEADQSNNKGGTLFSYSAGNDSYTRLVSFSGQDNVGSSPRGSLVKGTSGNLYGIVSGNKIFKYNPSTHELSSVGDAPLDISENNASQTLMLASNGKIMGMTASGIIYSFYPNTNAINIELETNKASNVILTEANNNLYALVKYDENDNGPSPKGAIIKFDDSDDSLENIFSFGHTNARATPSTRATLTKGPNGHLYGLSSGGGIPSFFATGALFEYDPSTDYYQNIHVFYSDEDGRNPEGGLLLADNNRLYGYTNTKMFEYDLTNRSYSQVIDFVSNSTSSTNIPIQASNGKIYGTLAGNPALFEYDMATGNHQIIYYFSTLPNNINSIYGNLMELNGKLYGLVSNGISGYLFEYNMSTSEVVMKVNFYRSTKIETGQYPMALVLADNNKLYGTASRGGTSDLGTLFEYDPANDVFTKKIDFSLPDGKYPFGGLLQASNGKLYGRTHYGGSENKSILYEYDITSDTYAIVMEYDALNNNAGTLLEISSDNPTSVPGLDMDDKSVSVYPNPTTGHIRIDSDIEISSIKIYNQIGQLVSSNFKRQSIDISHLNAGIYIIKLIDREGIVKSHKIIKK
ncbi:MAG: T9SS type A sorting domain-containing protein [Marinilabiliaceae bacterium]|nr:T9SS type A sorting domain-containing protein [Marinilabiliaceae bacterium]